MNVLVFDIETVPDVDGGRRLYDLDGLSDKEVANILFHKRRQQTGNEFLRLHLHRVVAISAVLRHGEDQFKVWSLGDPDASERELVQRFYDGLDRFTPTLVSWNGSGFDLPVLHYRALVHGIQAPRYWDSGDEDREFRWNNYLNRYHSRHLDLMDVLAAYQPRANAPLDEIATLLGFPGKMGMSGAKVWDTFQAGGIEDIRNYCETDVLNTYLVYLRFELMRGQLMPEAYEAECRRLREKLEEEGKPHFREFLAHWKSSPET
ncbi:3'-5' exonuclease [Thiohalomonas denitrificans]|uniref:3'-5' exonuclease n=1 Tax=Thiohalomonas denitrificans TaxID=415747 RepID=UPI0026EDD105|nr:3'-5' exonuclease [Thiohalomonas denitrificans]